MECTLPAPEENLCFIGGPDFMVRTSVSGLNERQQEKKTDYSLIYLRQENLFFTLYTFRKKYMNILVQEREGTEIYI